MSLYFLAGISVRNPLICSSLTKEWCIFANPNLKIMEDYIKKAADAFLVERPYGMRVDYSKDMCCPTVTSMCWAMGNMPAWRNCLKSLMWTRFPGRKIIKEHAGFTDVFLSIRLYQSLCRACAESEEASRSITSLSILWRWC